MRYSIYMIKLVLIISMTHISKHFPCDFTLVSTQDILGRIKKIVKRMTIGNEGNSLGLYICISVTERWLCF